MLPLQSLPLPVLSEAAAPAAAPQEPLLPGGVWDPQSCIRGQLTQWVGLSHRI